VNNEVKHDETRQRVRIVRCGGNAKPNEVNDETQLRNSIKVRVD